MSTVDVKQQKQQQQQQKKLLPCPLVPTDTFAEFSRIALSYEGGNYRALYGNIRPLKCIEIPNTFSKACDGCMT